MQVYFKKKKNFFFFFFLRFFIDFIIVQTPAYKPEGGGDFTPGHSGMFGMSPAWETPAYEPNKRY